MVVGIEMDMVRMVMVVIAACADGFDRHVM